MGPKLTFAFIMSSERANFFTIGLSELAKVMGSQKCPSCHSTMSPPLGDVCIPEAAATGQTSQQGKPEEEETARYDGG